MRHQKDGRWITAGSVLLLLVAVGGFEILVLTSLPGTHPLPSHSSISALFRAWR
jgi:hypothetical protein